MEWFRHDTDARNDIKLKKLARTSGLAGIGAFWVVAEVLFEHGGVCPVQDVQDELDYYDSRDLLDTLQSLNLIEIDGTTVSSHRVKEEIAFQEEARQKKSEAGKKGMLSRWGNRVITKDNAVITEDNKGYQPITGDNTLPNLTLPIKKDTSPSIDGSVSKESKAFHKPSLEEIRAYCEERNNGVDPQRFIDYYETRNWIPSGSRTQMKDWKAAVRTWEKSNPRTSGPSQKTNKHKDYSDVKAEDFDVTNFSWGV